MYTQIVNLPWLSIDIPTYFIDYSAEQGFIQWKVVFWLHQTLGKLQSYFRIGNWSPKAEIILLLKFEFFYFGNHEHLQGESKKKLKAMVETVLEIETATGIFDIDVCFIFGESKQILLIIVLSHFFISKLYLYFTSHHSKKDYKNIIIRSLLFLSRPVS